MLAGSAAVVATRAVAVCISALMYEEFTGDDISWNADAFRDIVPPVAENDRICVDVVMEPVLAVEVDGW